MCAEHGDEVSRLGVGPLDCGPGCSGEHLLCHAMSSCWMLSFQCKGTPLSGLSLLNRLMQILHDAMLVANLVHAYLSACACRSWAGSICSLGSVFAPLQLLICCSSCFLSPQLYVMVLSSAICV